MSILYSISPLGDEIFSRKSDYTCGPWEDLGVVIFSPHQLLVIVNLPPQTDISTKREHETIIYILLPPSVSQIREKYSNTLT
jgi:hypothetical protein